MQSKFNQTGVTLIELLLAVAVLAVLVSLAVPNMSDTAMRNAVKGEQRTYLGALHFARNEAISRSKTVSICPSIDGTNCAEFSTDWSFGFIVFIDDGSGDGHNGNGALEDGEEVLLAHQSKSTTQISAASIEGAGLDHLTWNYRGFAQIDQQALLVVCHKNDAESRWARGLFLDFSGRVISIDNADTSNGLEDGNGILPEQLECA